MDNKIVSRLNHILLSIQDIDDALKPDFSFNAYDNQRGLQLQIERSIMTIGEAINNITKMDGSIIFTNARRIVDARNFLIHEYDRIDNALVWNIITRHIPILKAEVQDTLNSH